MGGGDRSLKKAPMQLPPLPLEHDPPPDAEKGFARHKPQLYPTPAPAERQEHRICRWQMGSITRLDKKSHGRSRGKN